ncbi:MAG: PAS domain S-box protein, partial [Candidatus Verstraetearchaeota archaeon]|nr:PAS domain S-box protein [Candidatus Verstraetearchaeota archaeon]
MKDCPSEGFKGGRFPPQEFLDLVRAILFELDADGKVLWVNKFGLDFFGFSEDEIIGRSVYDTVVPLKETTGRDLRNLFDEVLKNGGEIVPRINENIKKDGSRVWVYWTNRVIKDESGRPEFILSAGIDVTSEVALEIEKRRSLELAEALLRVYRLLVSPETTLEDISRALLEEAKKITGSKHGFICMLDPERPDRLGLFETSNHERSGIAKEEPVQAEPFSAFMQSLKTTMGVFGNSPAEVPTQIRLLGNGMCFERFIAVPAVAGNDTTGLVVLANSSRDYTDSDLRSVYLLAQYFALAAKRKQEEEKLRRSELFYRALFEGNPIPTFTIREDNTIVQVNGAFERTFKCKKEEVEGKMTWMQFVHSKDLPRLMGYRKARITGRPAPQTYEATALDREGNELDVLVSVSLEKDSVITVVNLTRLKAVEQELKRKKEELEAYTRHLEEEVSKKTRELLEKERLAAIGQAATMVGHDLRNPLQAIMNLCYLIDDQIEAKQKQPSQLPLLVRKIERNVKYMDKIVADLQDFGKRLFVEGIPTRLQTIFEDAIVGIDVPDGVHIKMDAEEAEMVLPAPLITRALKNLIINAIQAMPNGGEISLSAKVLCEKAVFSVSDTGTGIAEVVKKNLFKPFFTTKSKGTGLGLAVVKKIVDEIGGTIEVDSELNRGTTFRIYVPTQRREEKKVP